MAEVPVTIKALVYPKNKSVEPFPATIIGFASIAGLEVGGGPIMPPPDVTPEPPLVIWGPNDPRPGWGLPEAPPEEPPAQPEPIHEGWNWAPSISQWVYVYVPKEGNSQPKRR